MTASLSVCLLVSVIIVVPVFYLTLALASELSQMLTRVEQISRTGNYEDSLSFVKDPVMKNIYHGISRNLRGLQIDFPRIIENALREVGTYSVTLMTIFIKDVAMFIVNVFLMLFTMYYFLKDGDIIFSGIKNMLPLTDIQIQKISFKFKDIIYASIYGTLAAAVAQGLLGGLAFWYLQLNSPVFWGTIMGILAVIPMLGAFFIWMPASVILFIKGSYLAATALFLWGAVVISLIDNLIWPYIVSERTMLHPILTFFGFLGGILVFGPVGIFAGPFVVALLLVLIDIFYELPELKK